MTDTGDKERMKELKDTFDYKLNLWEPYDTKDKRYSNEVWESVKRGNWVKWEIRK